jgi:hypothetical protein
MLIRPELPAIRGAQKDIFISQLRALPDHEKHAVRENFLTACFVAALAASPALRRRTVVRLVGGATWKRHRLSASSILVGAQVRHERPRQGGERTSIIDLVFEVNGRHRIGVEVKLGAPEGVDSDGRKQLERYLALPELDAVAYLTRDETGVPPTVLAAASRRGRYLVPRGASGQMLRQHFLWGDVYGDVEVLTRGRNASPVVIALEKLLADLGVQPVHPLIGDLGGGQTIVEVPAAVRENRIRLQEAMLGVRDNLGNGWETTENGPRTNGTLYLWREDDAAPGLYRVRVSFGHTPGLMRFSVEAAQREAGRALRAKLVHSVLGGIDDDFGRELHPVVYYPTKTMRPTVDISIPLLTLLAGVRTHAGVSTRLSLATNMITLAIQRALRRP